MCGDIIKMVGACNNRCKGWLQERYLDLCELCKGAVCSSIPCSLDNMEMEEIWRRTEQWRKSVSKAQRCNV
jgi:hypothetical protein